MILRSKEVSPPKIGSRYRVLAVCRISTEHQNELSLDDQLALYKGWLDRELPGPYTLEKISSRGSGEVLDREELLELSEKIESGEYDLVIAEDLGRIVRRIHAMVICESAVDTNTRVVAINDHVDTAVEGWQQSALFATFRHESYNADTSRRIRRSLRNRFLNGGVVGTLPAGYVKPKAGATDLECSKDADAEPVFDEWFTRLESGQSFAEIAEWLNSIEFPTGPGADQKTWNGTLVGQTTFNPLLKGLRVRNDRVSIRVNRTGRHRSVAAPPEMRLTREVPHLAFIEPACYDRVVNRVRHRNDKYRAGIAMASDRRSRTNSQWPAQHVRCGICGRRYVRGGHGRKDRMMCDGARRYQCWNAMTVSAPQLAQTVCDELRHRVEQLPDFDDEWIRRLHEQARQLTLRQDQELSRLQRDRGRISREVENLAGVIADGLQSQAVIARLRESEGRLADLDAAISQIHSRPEARIEIPSADELRRIAADTFRDLSIESREFGRIMRDLIDDFFVLPYRLVDGGHIEPRCVFTVRLGSLNGIHAPADAPCMQLNCMVDLTKQPQRAEHRQHVVELRRGGMSERDIARSLGITTTAAQRAAKLQRDMDSLGITDPWRPVQSHTEAADYFKRISHPRHEFKPLEGFTPRFPSVDENNR